MNAENGIRSKVVGSLLGDEAIPPEWLDGLGLRSVVERVAGDLYDVFYEDRVFPTEEYRTW